MFAVPNRRIRDVHGENATSDSTVRRWARHFDKGPRTNVRDEDRMMGRPPLVDDGLVREMEGKLTGDRRFTIAISLSTDFSQ